MPDHRPCATNHLSGTDICCTRLGGDRAASAHDEPTVSLVVSGGISIGNVLQIEVGIGATDLFDARPGGVEERIIGK